MPIPARDRSGETFAQARPEHSQATGRLDLAILGADTIRRVRPDGSSAQAPRRRPSS